MKILFIILNIFIWTIANSQIFDEKLEIEVLNDVFLDLIGTNYYYKIPPPPPKPLEFCKTNQDSIIFYEWLEDLKNDKFDQEIDTSRLIIELKNKSAFPADYEIKSIKNRIDYFDKYTTDTIDTTGYIHLIKNLVDKSKYVPKTINLKDINKTGRYELLDSIPFQVTNIPDSISFIGYLMFSRVYFNDNKDKCVFYMSFVCGGECGTGDVVLLKKIKNKWTVIWTLNLWIS